MVWCVRYILCDVTAGDVPVSVQTLDMEEWHMTTHSSRALVNYPKNRYINIVPCECCGWVLWACAEVCAVGMCCGRVLWVGAVGGCCGRVLWACAVGVCYGRVLWACAVGMC